MASQKLQMEAINIGSDIEDFFESYQIQDVNEIDQLITFVSKIEDLKRNFRRIHAQLRAAEGENYTEKYPDFNTHINELTTNLKSGNEKLNEMKKNENEKVKVAHNLRSELETEKLKNEMQAIKSKAEEKKLQCTSERNFIIEQINWQLEKCQWEKVEPDEIKSSISMFECKLESFYRICSHVESLYSGVRNPEFESFSEENDKIISSIREKIDSGHMRILEIKADKERVLQEKLELDEKQKELDEIDRVKQIEIDEKARIQNLLVGSKSLQFEIKSRHDLFLDKCKINIDLLSDYEILDLKKREENFHVEIRELIDRVSSFEKYLLPCGPEASAVIEGVVDMRKSCIDRLVEFLGKINSVISARDISEKKLKNATGLKINLSKFKGYNSEIDIYTLRSEFKKLIEPNVQKGLWADYLKKNCLIGPAYNLVAKIDEIDNIWKKLIEVYGNTQLLLHNKISSLGKFANLEKLKDDEKIANSITCLLNVMTDLAKLAKDYDLEGELYYGGGLQKVMALIGNTRERKFIKSIAKDNLKNDKKWEKLVLYMQAELRDREALILNEKAKKCISIDPKSSHPDKLNNPDASEGQVRDKAFASDYDSNSVNCHICGKVENHVCSIDKNGKKVIQYVACKTFVDLKPRDRDRLLFRKRFCSKCLMPGVKWDSEHNCDKTYACNQKYVKDGKDCKCEKHVLTCGFHASEKSNESLLKLYKKNVIVPNAKFSEFTKEIKISFFSEIYCNDKISENCSDENEECSSIYAFQTINVEGIDLNIFYDNGCGDLVISKETVDQLKEKGLAEISIPGPIILEGVSNQKSVCDHGIYNISLPIGLGFEAKMRGICVDSITKPFPIYPLENVEKDFKKSIAKEKGVLPSLPSLPKSVGGKVHIMIGKQYLKYFPKEVARLESGLTLYESCFKGSDGTSGIISGPHPEFSKTDKKSHFSQKRFTFLNALVIKYNQLMDLRHEVPLLGYEGSKEVFDSTSGFTESFSINDGVVTQVESSKKLGDYTSRVTESFSIKDTVGAQVQSPSSCPVFGDGVHINKKGPKNLKKFDKMEDSATTVLYRCPKCRNCLDCKNGCEIDSISIQEEVEQDLINKSIIVDIEKRVCTAKLPFIADPNLRLKTNLKTSRKIYNAQVKKLRKSEKDLKDVIEAEGKLQSLGFVEYLENLDEKEQEYILRSLVLYYIPWRVVWSKSITTPIRPVFDASHAPSGECSLNDILAKGTNNINNLIQMLIRWRIWLNGFHTDVTKMYNAVQLDPSHWQYQLYLWQDKLDPNIEPKTKVVKTVIYGQVSSGNLAERAIRLTAEQSKNEFPNAYEILLRDLYVDDCISGRHTHEESLAVSDEIKLSVEKGGFSLKGFTFTGEDPDLKLSGDKKYITVGGIRWYSKEDILMLDIDVLNFAEKIRGRKSENMNEVPKHLTMRDCVRKVAEMFDPLGFVVPLIASMKLDISHLHRSGLTWDDQIPDNLRGIWESNFAMMEEIRNIKFKRAVVPIDAKSLDIVTLDSADASSKLICAAIHVRFKKKDGSFSCQLVFSRSKVLPEDVSTPRAELMAAHMCAATGHTVQKAFGAYHKKALKFSDSMVALHWISNQRTALKTWVRNRVIEINRLCDVSDWRYVKSSDMIADLGTRQTAKIIDIIQGSYWNDGFVWMGWPECDFPAKTIDEIKLTSNESKEANTEMIIPNSFYCAFNSESNKLIDQEIKSRYTFSKYLVDPNRFRFRKVVRILALALKFVYNISKKIGRISNNKMFNHKFPYDLPNLFEANHDRFIVTNERSNSKSLKCTGGKVIEVSNFFLKCALFYFSVKTSAEVKQFVAKSKYVNITTEIDGILYYSGRILPDYSFEGYPELCESAIDLCRTTFCVPVVDQYSPVAISIAMEIHWHHPDVQHTGIETILRQTHTVAHIIEGRKVTKFLKQGCYRCRILNKASINALMGPIQSVNLSIAPAFYASQIDIFGPFKSYSNANKRATVKVWFLIFCCCTTGAVDIRVMEDYSTDSFILSFVRFSCRFGYPMYLLPDPGSQLIKGCKNMSYSYIDCKQKLSIEYGVQYLPCPVGAHYVHGKVERKIREVKKCVNISVQNERLSIIQWETLMQSISNSINNLPIGLKNKTENLENLDILTPNRLILGRNNERCPNSPVILTGDCKKVIEANANIFKAWFRAWLISYVPTLIERPKWHSSDKHLNIGDVVLFLKSEQEYDKEYQYGIVTSVKKSRDGHIREVEVEYKNHNESVKRRTKRGVRDLVIIHHVDELSIYERLDNIACE